MFGATDEVIQEAVYLAKHPVGWSVYLNGMQRDHDQFAEEFKQIGRVPRRAGAGLKHTVLG